MLLFRMAIAIFPIESYGALPFDRAFRLVASTSREAGSTKRKTDGYLFEHSKVEFWHNTQRISQFNPIIERPAVKAGTIAHC